MYWETASDFWYISPNKGDIPPVTYYVHVSTGGAAPDSELWEVRTTGAEPPPIVTAAGGVSYSNVSGFEVVLLFDESVTGSFLSIGEPFDIVFGAAGVAPGHYESIGEPFEIVVAVDESVVLIHRSIGEPFEVIVTPADGLTTLSARSIGEPIEIVVSPDSVTHIIRGGGQSTVEWDWVWGKVK